MKQVYTVQVNDAPSNYAQGYFPRKVHYKKDAIRIAQQAVSGGATMARVECPNGGELDFRPEQKVGQAT